MAYQKDTENSETIESFIHQWESEKPKIFSPEQLQDFTSDFSKKLGYGSFGDVFQGIYNGKQVAVKVLKEVVLADNIKDQFIAEVSTLGNIHQFTMFEFRGTPYYCAPELSLPYLTKINHKCDVYSYGMMLFDIVSMSKHRSQEAEDWFPRTVWDKYEKGKLEEVMTDCIEEKDREMGKRILMIALNCVEFFASNRPSMSDVVRFLEGTKDPPLPPDPFLSSPPQASSSIVVPNNRNLELESGVVDKMINSHDEKEKERDGDIIVEIRYKSIGPWGGSGGSEWDDGVFPGILQIEIVSARREICSIEIEYCGNDGTSVGWSNKHGRNPGQQTDKIVFDYPSEYLMGITGFMHVPRNSNLAVRSLSFITNKKIHGPYGVNLIVKGDPFTSGKLGKVVGFHGRSGDWLNAIGVHMEYDPNI